MRIFLTVPSLDRGFGGPAAKARHLRAALARHGHRVVLATVGDHEDAGILALPRIGSFRGTPIPGSWGRLRVALAGADLLHVLGYRDPLGTIGALQARGRAPYLLEPLGMHRRRAGSLRLKAVFDISVGRLVTDRASRIIANSQLEAAELRADGLAAPRIAVRPDGVELEGLVPLPARGQLRARLGIPGSAPLVLSLARLATEKALPGLAKAVARLDGVWLLVAGPDQEDGTLTRLRGLRQHLPGGSRIVLAPGGLWGQDKARALADADVFAQPSMRESFGIAAAEAACCGLPVIISDACGVKEHLHPDATRIVPAGEPEQIGPALEEILTAPDCSEQARTVAPDLRARLSWDGVAARQLRIYRDVLEEGR